MGESNTLRRSPGSLALGKHGGRTGLEKGVGSVAVGMSRSASRVSQAGG